MIDNAVDDQMLNDRDIAPRASVVRDGSFFPSGMLCEGLFAGFGLVKLIAGQYLYLKGLGAV